MDGLQVQIVEVQADTNKNQKMVQSRAEMAMETFIEKNQMNCQLPVLIIEINLNSDFKNKGGRPFICRILSAI